MSISNEVVEQLYTADGVVDTFAIPCDFIDGDESTVIKVYTVVILTGVKTLMAEGALQDYTFDDNGVDPPTTITFNTPPPATVKVLITRSLTLRQITEYISGAFPYAAHEKQMDKIVMMIQQLNADVARSLKLNVLTTPFDPTMPLLAANKTLVVGPTGTTLVLGPTPDELSGALGNVVLAEAARDAAIAAQAAAEIAQAAAELAETNAELAETNAETAETNAELAETNAETAETNAAASAAAAAASAAAAVALGVPTGGTTGQALVKASNTDQDTNWVSLTKTLVGLANVDNTSDANKPVSTATQTALDLKAPIASPTFTGTVGGVTAAMVGLGNVDNTSDATKNSATVTLTNKTLTSPVINSPTGIVKADVGLGNVDNTSDATKNSATATLTNKTIDGSLNTITNVTATVSPSATDLINCSIVATVAGNALTIALKTQAGADPSGGSPVSIGFRSTTLTSGAFSQVSATAATSVVVSNGSTLGTVSATSTYLYVYALNNSGTIELAVMNGLVEEALLATTTAEGGAGNADSANTLYSTTARTTKAVRLIGRVFIAHTAGAWSSAPTEVSSFPFRSSQYQEVQSGGLTNYTGGAGVYADIASLVLTPGEYDLSALTVWYANGALTTARIFCGINTTSGNSSLGRLDGNNWTFNSASQTNGTSMSQYVPNYRVVVSTTTTYYLKGNPETSVTNLQIAYRFSARRVK